MEDYKPEIAINDVNAFLYVIEYSSFKILYTNRTKKEESENESERQFCYEVILGKSEPCEDCPMKLLSSEVKSTWSIKRLDCSKRWIMVEFNDVVIGDGAQVCIVTGVDVTSMQDAVFNMERVLNSIHASAYSISTKDFRLNFLNKELQDMLPEVRLGDLCYKVLWNNTEPCSFCPIKQGKEFSAHMNRYNNRLKKYLSIDVVSVNSAKGEQNAIFTAYDVSKLIESENRLKMVAYIDPLTEIRNRIAFLENITSAFFKGMNGCVAMLNIKNLKKYNLLYDKKKGDELIKKVAVCFAAAYKENKTYRVDGGKLGFIAIGNEEIMQLRAALHKAEQQFLSEWSNPNFRISFDIAIVLYPEFAQSPEQVIYYAEYLLKKNRAQVDGILLEFDEQQQKFLRRRDRIEEILQNGNFSERFQVYYQPIYDIQKDSYSKCEALLRLKDEELGWVPPVEFIPIAEESGYIGELGKFVLQNVCKFLEERIDQKQPPLLININVSPMEFARNGFYDDVISTVEHYRILPKYLQLEVTESVLVYSMECVIDIMNRLIAYGFTFAIDDFGTGYSNFSYIGMMPVECLKLDKGFMDMILYSESHRLIVTNVIEIAKGLKLSIVAEGIESREQYELIKKLGSNYIQGYLFSKPLPQEEFMEFLTEHSAGTCRGSS